MLAQTEYADAPYAFAQVKSKSHHSHDHSHAQADSKASGGSDPTQAA